MDEPRWIEHTADVGAELTADDLPGLFRIALAALLEVLMEAPPGAGTDAHRVRLRAATLDVLLVRWLEEWIFRIQTRGRVPVVDALDLAVEGEGSGAASGGTEPSAATGWQLEASVRESTLDPAAHGWRGEVKGATYHGLEVVRRNGRWHARIVFDV